MSTLSRRTFVAMTPLAALAPAVRPRVAAADALRFIDGGLPSTYPTQSAELVRSIVGKAHVDYDAVHTLVTARRELAKAAWDWGFGDWESALGAASHMGRRDIAELLIAHGARPNLFTFAMFGQVDVVRAVCAANPGIQRQPGPHGISLLQHARFGKDEAKDVVAYLEELGDANPTVTNLPVPDDGVAYVGDYEPAGAPDAIFHIGLQERRKVLTFARDDRQLRFLNHLGEHRFSPGGAASVVIAFEMHEGRATGLAIRDGDLMITAKRKSWTN
jgi:hypothetical protein